MVNKELLNKLIEQKRNVIIVVYTNIGETSYNSKLIRVDENYLYLSNEDGLNRYNINTNIYCYFNIISISQKNEKKYFYFKSMIHNLNRKYVMLNHPDEIIKGQRRKGFRMHLTSVDFARLNIYEEKSILTLTPENNKKTTTPLFDMDYLKNNKIIIQDISSGGIKINFHDFSFIDLHKNKIFVIELKLIDLQNLKMPTFFLQGQVARVFKNTDKIKTAGIKFIKRGFPDTHNNVKWKDLANNYVEEIDGWIFEKCNN